MPGSTLISVERDRGLALRTGADASGDKEACAEQGDAHGGGCRVSVEFGGLGQASAKDSRKNFTGPKCRVGFVREWIIKNQVGERCRFDEVAKVSFQKLPLQLFRDVSPAAVGENFGRRAVVQVREAGGMFGGQDERIEIMF